ncbi:MAG: hypothetical protein ABIE94_00155 [archaeon]
MKKLLVLLVLLIIPSLVYGLNCWTAGSCAPTFITISDTNNAHVGIPAAYATDICCNQPTSVGGFSADAEVYLSWSNNAHASETYDATWYPVSLTLANTECIFESNACSMGRECVISLSGSTNAHVGECPSYYNKLCCCDNMINELCGPVENPPDGGVPGCDNSGTWCCPAASDCVLDQGTPNCYSFGTNDPSGNLICSNQNHWCPVGFFFNTTAMECQYEAYYCDMGNIANPPDCLNPFDHASSCFSPVPPNVPPMDACCDVGIEYNGYDYYDWSLIDVY